MSNYEQLKASMAQGWNTWNTRSVLSHVLLPHGFAINLCLKNLSEHSYLKEALIGRRGKNDEIVHPGGHAYDGSYTSLKVYWRGIELQVQSATQDGDLVILATPLVEPKHALLVVEAGLLWNKPGTLSAQENGFMGQFGEQKVQVFVTQAVIAEPNIPTQAPYLAMHLKGEIGISTGKPRSLAEIKDIIAASARTHHKAKEKYGDLAETYDAIQTCLAWDTIYEPEKQRVVTPVSRIWSVNWGGFVLFDWDTYFAAYMAALDNKELAYANAIEITREHTESGFVPNFGTVWNVKSRDRSQPPVGSMVFRELYRRYREKWVLEEVFAELLAWNRWWPPNRSMDGLLAWGSTPYTPLIDSEYEVNHVNDLQAAAWESGLDNSPMYDDIPYDADRHIMLLADAGLTGMYIMDCYALADIARILGKQAEAEELTRRGDEFGANTAGLWDESHGMFCNKRLDTGEFSHRVSPTNYYPLLGGAASQAQADRMVKEFFFNPQKFWGEYMIPTSTRDDPGYADQFYWRGRIWGPTNFLAYLSLRKYGLPEARTALAEKSKNLFLKNWREHHYVAENYNTETGEGGEINSSDRYYHWGGLLGFLSLIEAGFMEGWEKPLDE